MCIYVYKKRQVTTGSVYFSKITNKSLKFDITFNKKNPQLTSDMVY